jgi:putative DNA primase/helicase
VSALASREGMVDAEGRHIALWPRPEGIPAEMRAAARWVLWRFETRDGKPTKVPYDAKHPGMLPVFASLEAEDSAELRRALNGCGYRLPIEETRRASSTDPETWADFALAHHVFLASSAYDGIGFALGDGWVGIDLDRCADQAHAQIDPWATEILVAADSFAEWSPQGTGLHVILRGELPPGRSRRGPVEMYGAGRYFTVTGWGLPGHTTLRSCSESELGGLRDRILPAPIPAPARPVRPAPLIADDHDLLARARRAANGALFGALYDHGDVSGYGGDDSAADMALADLLMYWAGGDADRADRLFRRSALMRDKWDERRGESTYGQRTLATAAASGTTQPARFRPIPVAELAE